MVIELDNQCLICGEHDVESFSVGPLDAKIVVVTNRKSSGRFQDALDLQLKELGIDEFNAVADEEKPTVEGKGMVLDDGEPM